MFSMSSEVEERRQLEVDNSSSTVEAYLGGKFLDKLNMLNKMGVPDL